MSDAIPPAPRLPADTLRAPDVEDPTELMRELRAALANVGDLIQRLDTRLACTQLATLTLEHKVNMRAERDEDFDARLRVLEGLAAE